MRTSERWQAALIRSSVPFQWNKLRQQRNVSDFPPPSFEPSGKFYPSHLIRENERAASLPVAVMPLPDKTPFHIRMNNTVFYQPESLLLKSHRLEFNRGLRDGHSNTCQSGFNSQWEQFDIPGKSEHDYWLENAHTVIENKNKSPLPGKCRRPKERCPESQSFRKKRRFLFGYEHSDDKLYDKHVCLANCEQLDEIFKNIAYCVRPFSQLVLMKALKVKTIIIGSQMPQP